MIDGGIFRGRVMMNQRKKNLETLEKELGEKIAENYKRIEEEPSKYNCEDGGFHSGRL